MGRYKKGNGVFADLTARLGKYIVFLCALVIVLPELLFASEFLIVEVKDAISPPIASYLIENIDEALAENMAAVIIRLDTPGGLDTAMRDIIQHEMNANIPVIVYVSPKGARAASAGAIITLAADVAAMAPGTNIGAAHPVNIGKAGDEKGEDTTMVEKVTNDAVAYARSIAKERGRNEQWAEDAVRKSISTPANEALEIGVVDILAENMDDLLAQLDGRVIKKGATTFELQTKGAHLVENPMGLRYRLLAAISNPNIAYILMLIGLAGIYFELSSPGAILPGVIGGISLILAFFALQTLPVNFAGVALILLAVILFIAEIKVPSFGLLTVGGIISMILGSLLLFRTPELYAQVSLMVILPITLFFTGFFVACLYLVVKVHRTSPVSGAQGLKGEKAEVHVWDAGGKGKVFCHGEYWNARGPALLSPGDSVEVVDLDGMDLIIRPVAEKDGAKDGTS
ncbi:MAG: nodulation protein NfeD [Deltaproteobacteria bacterium]|nr:nodulation protein NfeD [Deltaproteobacteria bacterium]